MNVTRWAILLDLIAEWAGIINKNSADSRMAQMKAELNETWFAWSGATTGSAGSNITAYYRIQGPHLVIENAPQNDAPANHVHTIHRDPANDYGRALRSNEMEDHTRNCRMCSSHSEGCVRTPDR
jgi:hypothetical protein